MSDVADSAVAGLSYGQIAAQAGHDVCRDCGWCVDCAGHNMWCLTGGTE